MLVKIRQNMLDTAYRAYVEGDIDEVEFEDRIENALTGTIPYEECLTSTDTLTHDQAPDRLDPGELMCFGEHVTPDRPLRTSELGIDLDPYDLEPPSQCHR